MGHLLGHGTRESGGRPDGSAVAASLFEMGLELFERYLKRLDMFDLQKLMDTTAEMDRDTRKKYHVTLGQLLDELERDGAINRVVVDLNGTHYFIWNGCSYRGYYADLSLLIAELKGEVAKEVPNQIEMLKGLLGQTMSGYKGGEFLIDRDAPLWVTNQVSNCSNLAVISFVKEMALSGNVTLVLKVKDVG
jgi:hypothetical protein